MTTALIPDWTIGDRLAKAREVAGISIKEMAPILGVSRNTVSNYEHGHTRPTRAVVLAYAASSGVDIHWLLTGEVPVTDGYPSPTSLAVYRWSLDNHMDVEVDDMALTRALIAAVPEDDRRRRQVMPPRGRWEREGDEVVALQLECAA